MTTPTRWKHLDKLWALLPLAALFLPATSVAQQINLDPGMTVDEKRDGWLPYVFATESLETAIGAGGGVGGLLQPQFSAFGTGFVTTNDSWSLIGAFNNLQIPATDRLFLDGYLLLGHFTDERFYIDLDRDASQAQGRVERFRSGRLRQRHQRQRHFRPHVEIPARTGQRA